MSDVTARPTNHGTVMPAITDGEGRRAHVELPIEHAEKLEAQIKAALVTARNHLPAVYPYRRFVDSGGLAAYSNHALDVYQQAATYVDRILRGAKPADLAVQAPTKYETVVNLKTAKSLGIEVPPSLLVRADEVIE
jgi:ABC-type uncharacterized transport system substrate-binding protein